MATEKKKGHPHDHEVAKEGGAQKGKRQRGKRQAGKPKRPEVEIARDCAHDARVQRRVLNFFNAARFAEQLTVAPHDRLEVDEETHHTGDHRAHFHHHEERLIGSELAKVLLLERDRNHPLGLRNAQDLTALHPRIAELFPGILAAFGAATYGRWDLLYDLEVGGTHIEIEHAALLRNGHVIFLADGTDTLLWDPSDEVTPQLSLLDGAATGLTTNLLCGGHSFLSDGQLLVGGGGGFGPGTPNSNQAWKFNPVTQTWTKTAGDMSTLRWYPTTLTLGDEVGPTGASGRVLVAGGEGAGGAPMEVYSEATDSFTTVTQNGVVTHDFPQTYPGLNLLPGGEVFYTPTGFGNCSTGSVYGLADPSGYFTFSAPQGATDGSWTSVSAGMNRTKGMNVLLLRTTYPFVRVLVVGGGDNATNKTVQQINLSTFSPSWGPNIAIPDGRSRVNVNVVLLPDGTVFISGGTQSAPHTCYIYDPDTAISPWKEMDELNAPRHYHSCALLLPSGKVMAAGGASPGGCTASVENTIEVFSPPYLFNPDGSPAARPCIKTINGVVPAGAVAPTVHHGSTFVIETPEADDITRVVLARPMAATHNTDTEQRVIQCSFSKTGATQLSAVAPNGVHPHALAPRGYYMVFILNAKGTPSEAKFIHLH